MKQHARATAIALAIAAALGGTAQADSPEPRNNTLEAGAFLGLFLPSDDHEFYDPLVATQEDLASVGVGAGLRLGYYPLRFLGVEGEGAWARVGSDVDGSLNLLSVRGHLVAQLPLRVTPFVLGGLGTTWSRSDDDVQGDDRDRAWHVGLGAKLFATERLIVRVDGRAYFAPHVRDGLDDNGMTTHFGLTLGASWVFGGGGEPALEPDPDGDGVRGAADACPMVAGAPPSGCPADTDGDGIADPDDQCPSEPETANGVEDEDGCPDEQPDTDGDGLDDGADGCPSDPEDADGFEDEDGCPDPDNDGDGLLDGSDDCPDQVGPAENRGCPDADRDGDGVVDRLDNCPDEAGTEDNRGCKEEQLVALTETKIEILDKVYFASGRARLQRRSNRLLNNIAEVLTAHPEILKVRVEGHTDSSGRDAFNKELSQRRAQRVVDYLAGQGVDPARLEPIGFGEENPIESNDTREGRAANRRVEFNIAETAPPEAGQPASESGE